MGRLFQAYTEGAEDRFYFLQKNSIYRVKQTSEYSPMILYFPKYFVYEDVKDATTNIVTFI